MAPRNADTGIKGFCWTLYPAWTKFAIPWGVELSVLCYWCHVNDLMLTTKWEWLGAFSLCSSVETCFQWGWRAWETVRTSDTSLLQGSLHPQMWASFRCTLSLIHLNEISCRQIVVCRQWNEFQQPTPHVVCCEYGLSLNKENSSLCRELSDFIINFFQPKLIHCYKLLKLWNSGH